jgi:hypothetical protein
VGPHPRPLRRWSVRWIWRASPVRPASRPWTQPVWPAHLGTVRCGKRACYASIDTDDDHRRRRFASHLRGVAARCTADRGCNRWVIVTEATNPAGRVYRTVWVRARQRQRPDVPQAAALSHATTGEPSGVGSDEFSDNALNCRVEGGDARPDLPLSGMAAYRCTVMPLHALTPGVPLPGE